MRILFSILLLFAAHVSTAQTAAQPDAEQTKILAPENAWNLAEEHKDAKALRGGGCSSKISLYAESFAAEGLGRLCWLRSRGSQFRNIVTGYIGKWLTGMRRRSSFTSLWERSSATSGGRYC